MKRTRQSILFTVPGDPVPQGRPRFIHKNGKSWTYDHKESEARKDDIKMLASRHGCMDEGPLVLDVMFYRTPPSSWSTIKKQRAYDGDLWPVTRPDLDNYIKLILDALNGVSWADDSCVVQIRASKRYSQTARTVIYIRRMTNEGMDAAQDQ